MKKVYWLHGAPHCAQARVVESSPQSRPCAPSDPLAFRNDRGGWSSYIPGSEFAYVCEHDDPPLNIIMPPAELRPL